jgi:hypothetical protein
MDKRPGPEGTDPKGNSREETMERILSRLRDRLDRDFDDDVVTLDEIEDQSEALGEELKRTISEEMLKKRQREDEQQSRSVACSCGRSARYVGRRCRQLVLLSGSLLIERSYYQCRACHKGLAPLDDALGVGRGQCTRRVAGLIGRLSCYLPNRMVVEELEQLHGISLAVSTVQRYSGKIGQAIRRSWQGGQAQMQKRSLPASVEHPNRLHVTADGVMIHVGGNWREAKLGAVYQTTSSGQAVKARYYATLECSSVFGQRLRVLAHRSGSDHCCDIAGVADGAPWIWQEYGKHFPQSVQVLDYYHVVEHLWEAAHLRFGEGSAEAAQWMKQQKDDLLNDKVDQVIASVAEWRPRKQEKRTVRRRLLGYLGEHRHRMFYKTFSEAGYHIGSGVVESGCKNVVQIRMKRAGMRWSEQGAEAMLHLCSWYASHERGTLEPYLNA